jgi:SAM-dependent methyltransferase
MSFDLQRLAAATGLGSAMAEREATTGSARVAKARAFVGSLPTGSRILDIGCGNGWILAPFIGSLRVCGIDGHEEYVRSARAKGIDAEVGDIENLPYDSATFDAVFAGEVIEHTLSPDRFLCGINRVLKPGGVAILTVPNIRTPVGLLMFLVGLPPMFAARYRSSHLRDFTARLIKSALRNNGFEIVRLTGSAFMIPPFGPRLAFLGAAFPSWADHFVILSKKVRDASYDESAEFSGAL